MSKPERPKPQAPKQQQAKQAEPAAPPVPENTRTIFVRNDGLSVCGLPTLEEAHKIAESIKETPTQRVRVRLRQRTQLYDVLVKSQREEI